MQQLELHEGCQLKPYQDTTGHWTIGVGYNITDRGLQPLERVLGRNLRPSYAEIEIDRDEALEMLADDIIRIYTCLERNWGYFSTLDPIRQRVAIDFVFNVGGKTALTFKHTTKAAQEGRLLDTVFGLMRSEWAHQVGDRAERLARMWFTGEDYV